MLLVVLQTSKAHHARLGLLRGSEDTYRNVLRYRHARQVPRALILRYDAPLFFANSGHFRDTVLGEVEATQDVCALVLDCAPINSVDSTALKSFLALIDELEQREAPVRVILAAVKGPVRDRLEQAGLNAADERRFQPSIRAAVSRLVREGVLQDPGARCV